MPTALLTGATGKLGPSLARALAEDGHDLILVARGPEVARVADDVRVLGVRAVPVRMDLESLGEAGLDLLEAAALVAGARPTTLIHAAGDLERGGILSHSPGALARSVAVHAGAVLTLAAWMEPTFSSARTGRIVGFTLPGLERLGAYRELPLHAAAKAALRVALRSLAIDLAPCGVTVNALAVGRVGDGDDVGVDRIPAGRRGTAADVIGSLRFLLSPAADYVTGAELPVSGGYGL